MDENDAITKEELQTFYQPLVDISQYTLGRHFMSGSSAETPGNERNLKFLVNMDDKADILDDDIMHYTTLVLALPLGKPVPDTYTGDVFRIVTDEDTHPGYVRLINEIDDSRLDILKFMDVIVPEDHSVEDSEHGPAVKINATSDLNTVTKRYVRNATLDSGLLESVAGIFAETNDWVRAVHCPYWPIQASEWVTRPRSNNSPTRMVIKSVVKYGCDFVQVAHRLSCETHLPDANEWRFSFSKAELIIIRGWTQQQRIHYRTLWLIFKIIHCTNRDISALCTFYFKTLMLWACENKPSAFWSNYLITDSVCQLIYEMIEWLSIKFIPNYFIPDNNMMDHLEDFDVSRDIDALTYAISSASLVDQRTKCARIAEWVHMNAVHRIDMPSWISRTFIIFKRLHNVLDNYADLFCEVNSKALQNSLDVEFENIYSALKYQMKAVNCSGKSRENEYSSSAEMYLTMATSLVDSTDMTTVEDGSCFIAQHLVPSFYWLLPQEAMPKDNLPDNSNNVIVIRSDFKPNAEREKLEKDHAGGKNEDKVNQGIGERTYNNSKHTGSLDGSFITAYVIFDHLPFIEVNRFKNWPGTSPTVNITWFLAKTYLSNLYYTRRNDYALTISVCNEILDTYRMSKYNQFFAERTFPFVLRTKYAAIYDDEIQALLGFYSLCAYELLQSTALDAVCEQIAQPMSQRSYSTLNLNPRPRDQKGKERVGFYSIFTYILTKETMRENLKNDDYVYIGVCPIQFAHYLKCRCISHQYEQQQCIEEKEKNCVRLFQEHRPTGWKYIECMCAYDWKINCGWWLITCALKNFGQKMLTLRNQIP